MDTDDFRGDDHADLADGKTSTLRLRNPDRLGDQDDEAEARMRQALGLFKSRPSSYGLTVAGSHTSQLGHSHTPGYRSAASGPAARRHRFVQDGEVPVSVMRSQPAGRSLTAEAERLAEDLSRERHRAADLERHLHEAQAQVRGLQTRAGLAELERDRALAELQELRTHLEQEFERAPASLSTSVSKGRIELERTPVPLRRGRRRVEQAQLTPVEPEPVQWWLKS